MSSTKTLATSTKAQYRKRALMLGRKYGFAWSKVIADLDARKSSLATRTCVFYLAALKFHLESIDQTDEVTTALDCLNAFDLKGTLAQGQNTSAKKAKSVPEEDLRLLIAHLALQRSGLATTTILYLMADIITGPRPCEWETAKLIHKVIEGRSELVLVVKNAKASFGRTFGPTRTITLSSIDEVYQQVIMRFVEAVARWNCENAFDARMKQLKQNIFRASRRLWPDRVNHIAAYSCRHQFTADIKSIYSPLEVAALLGHASLSTAYRGYAPASAGRSWLLPGDKPMSIVPAPSAADVACVLELEALHKASRVEAPDSGLSL